MFLAKLGNKESCSESPSLLSTVAEVAFVAGNERKLSLRVRSVVRLFWGGAVVLPDGFWGSDAVKPPLTPRGISAVPH